jgi:hypothetical protein
MIETLASREVYRESGRRRPEKRTAHSKGKILQLLGNGSIDLVRASHLLKNTGIHGMVLAGEALLDQATKTTNLEEAQTHYVGAAQVLTTVERLSANGPDNLAAHVARARIIKSFIPVRAYMDSEKRLPPNDGSTSHNIYRTLVEEMVRLRDAYRKVDSWPDKGRLIGQLGEFTVLSLLSRFGEQHIDDQSYCAMPSLLTEDRQLNRSLNSFGPWDISIYTHMGEEEPRLTYRLQVKNQCEASTREEGDTELSWVDLRRDLALYSGESRVDAKIASEMAAEFYLNEDWATRHLDIRTGKLLDVIDA